MASSGLLIPTFAKKCQLQRDANVGIGPLADIRSNKKRGFLTQKPRPPQSLSTRLRLFRAARADEIEGEWMSGLRLFLLSVLFVVLPVAAVVSQPPAPGNFLEMLRRGGYVIVLRHGATTSDAAIDPMSNPGKTPAGERELSVSGRAQARSIGRALHELKIPVSLVMTSPQQRAVDTATLLDVGDVTTKANLAEADAAVSVEESYRRAAA